MQKSEVPSTYMLVKATSSFDGDKCDFALAFYHPGDVEELRAHITCAKLSQASSKGNFCSSTYYNSVKGYYTVNENFTEKQLNEMLAGQDFVFVEASELEIDSLREVASKVDYQRLEVFPHGDFCYSGEGAGTEILFRTSNMKLAQLESYFQEQ